MDIKKVNMDIVIRILIIANYMLVTDALNVSLSIKPEMN